MNASDETPPASEGGALPDETYSLLESVVLRALLLIGLGTAVGLVVSPEAVWDEGLAPVVWDPIVEDASETGDAGYNPWNTTLYTLGLFAAVLALQAVFRRWRLPSDDLMVLALTGRAWSNGAFTTPFSSPCRLVWLGSGLGCCSPSMRLTWRWMPSRWWEVPLWRWQGSCSS